MQQVTVKGAVSAARKKIASKEGKPERIAALGIIAFLISRAEVFSFVTPLGVSFMAAAYEGGAFGLLLLVASVLGMLTAGTGYMYVPAAVMLYLIMRFERKGSRTVITTAVYACASVLVSGLPAVIWLGGNALEIVRLLIFATAAFFGVYVFSVFLSVIGKHRRCLNSEEIISFFITLSLGVLGLPFEKIGYVTPAAVLCGFFILSSSLSSSVSSAAVGVVCGFILGCNTASPMAYMGVCAFCGLSCGIMGRFGKAGSASAFALCVIINACMAESPEKITFSSLDAALSVLLFFAVPTKVFERFGIKGDASGFWGFETLRERLKLFSGAFSQISESVKAFSDSSPKMSRFDMFDKAADSVCRDCKNCSLCWQKYYNDTYDVTMKCFHEVDKRGAVEQSFLPDYFRERCCDCEGFIRSINRTYEEFKDELLWRGRLNRAKELSANGFSEAAEAVDRLCADICENVSFSRELAVSVTAALEREGIYVKSATVFKNPYGRYEVKLSLPSCGGRDACARAEPVISEIMECGMKKTFGECMLCECSCIFSEASRIAVKSSIVGKAAEGEDVSGDSAVSCDMPDGNRLILLCDGKGVGKNANMESSEAVRLISKLIFAGFTPDSAVRLANSAMAECCEESYTTVDAAVINTVNGTCVFVKNGCCPTFIIREGGMERVGCTNLPVGVGNETEVNEEYGTLRSGDRIIMMSDGVYDAFGSEKTLKAELLDIFEKRSEDFASALLKSAKKRKGNRDDMTVIYTEILNEF